MTLTPSQLASARRAIEEIADDDAKHLTDTARIDSSFFIIEVADLAMEAVNLAVVRELSKASMLTAGGIPDEQFDLLRLIYIRRRIHIEIDRREERAIDLRVEDEA